MSEKKPQPKQLYLRFSTEDDAQRIIDFYAQHPHPSVRKRDHDLIRKLAEQCSITFIEDKDKNIVAISITYSHNVTEDGVEKSKWLEVGSTQIALNGYEGLFDIMVVSQVLRGYLFEPPSDRFVAHMEHKPIQTMAAKLGWRRYNAPKELIDISTATINADDTCDRSTNWFHCGVEAMPIMAKYMIKVVDDPVLKHRKTDATAVINFDRCPLIDIFKNQIKSLAGLELGSVEKPDLTVGMRDSRNRWLKALQGGKRADHYFKKS